MGIPLWLRGGMPWRRHQRLRSTRYHLYVSTALEQGSDQGYPARFFLHLGHCDSHLPGHGRARYGHGLVVFPCSPSPPALRNLGRLISLWTNQRRNLQGFAACPYGASGAIDAVKIKSSHKSSLHLLLLTIKYESVLTIWNPRICVFDPLQSELPV